MFKSILVPLDGSGRAEQALPVAARLVRASGGSLVLVRVVSTAPEHYPIAPAKPTPSEIISEDDLTVANSYLEGIAASQLLSGIHVKTEVQVGIDAPIILSVAASSKADLIVISSHGFTRVKRWVLGSVAEKVAHNADVPVLILREDSPIGTEQLAKGEHPLRILVPLDGSDYAKAALAPAAYLAAGLTESGNGILCLSHVVVAHHHDRKAKGSDKKTAPADQKSHSHEVQNAQKYLDTMVSQINDGYIAPDIANLHLEVTSSVVVGSDVAHELLNIAEHGNGEKAKKADFDIIAMTTHGHSGIQSWATGSVTGRVLHTSQMPLLIVRPADLARNR